MKILRLDISEFGNLKGVHYELGNGLNIFEGDNESGKSTVWLFIKFMLYGMPKKGNPERDKAINRTTHTAYGSMTVLWRGEEYRIERSFTENSKGRLSVYGGDPRLFNGREPGEVMLGVPRDVFENSCGIGQSACVGIGGEKGAAAIRNLLSSADESVDIEKIEKKLERIRVEYRHKNGKGGKLYELASEKADLECRLERATESRLRINDIEEKLKRNGTSLEENEKKLSDIRNLLGQLRKHEMIRRFDLFREKQNELLGVKKEREIFLSTMLETDHMPTAADVAELRSLAVSLERAINEEKNAAEILEGLASIRGFDADLAAVGESLEAIGGKDSVIGAFKNASKGTTTGLSLIIASVISCSVGAMLMGFFHPLGIVLLALGVVLIVTGVGLFFTFRKKMKKICEPFGKDMKELEKYLSDCADAYSLKQKSDREVAVAEGELNTARKHLSYYLEQTEKAVRRTSTTEKADASGAKREAERLDRVIERIKETDKKINYLSAVIANEEKILSAYNEEELRAGFSVNISELERINLDEIENSERFYAEKVRTQTALDKDLRTELINYKAQSEDPQALSDRIAEISQKYAAADRYVEAVVTAIEGIQRGAAALQGNITPAIGRNAGNMIDYISDGRYGSVNLGRDMDITLVGDDGLSTTGSMMSGGMRDVAYLALRISLMMQLYGRDMPPLMMDETLCQLDGKRMKRILSLIGKLCEGDMQCLLFTCHHRESEACRDLKIGAEIHEM